MSDFQIGLFLIGAIAIGAVIAYNRVQERRARNHAKNAFASQHADALMEGRSARHEPALSQANLMNSQASGLAKSSHAVDYAIEIDLGEVRASTLILEAWQPISRRFGHRAMLIGQGDDGQLRHVLAGSLGRFSELTASLQMVTRLGVVSESELLEFRSAVETLAAQVQGVVRAPEMRPALERARELNSACEAADVQVVLHVRPGPSNVLSHAALDALLEKDAWTRSDGGAWSLRNAEGDIRAALTTEPATASDPIKRLSLFLDVPRTRDLPGAFSLMTAQARLLESALSGRIEDDTGNRLDDAALERIGVQIDSVGNVLEQYGVDPGGPLAARLFQ